MIQKTVINHCKKHGISYAMETDTCAEFSAPIWMVFSTESHYRCVEIGDYIDGRPKRLMSASDVIDLLSLYSDEKRD